MKKFKAHLSEAKKSTVVVSFGRMNPMTNGHEKLANKLKSEAASRKADAKLYLSHSTNPKKDPLPFDTKVKFAKKAFGPMVQSSAARTIIEVAKELNGKYSTLVVVVGSDRVPEFKTLLDKYNGKEYTFDSIEIVSAGERDPDAEGVEGMSGSKMRKFAADKDIKNFSRGVPSKLSDTDTEQLYNAVRQGMKLDEQFSKMIEEGIQATADFKVSKSGKKYSAHKIVLGKKKEEPEEETKETKNEEAELDEAVLSLSQRRQRAIQFKRLQTRIQRARMLAMKRFADKKHLALRARRQARGFLKSRFASGKSYDAMATAQKIVVDKRLEKMKPVVGKIAARLLPKVRQAEVQRKMNTMLKKESFEIIDESANRLDQLIRYGLADKSMLSTIKRSVSKLQSGENLNAQERRATESLITTLLDMVTSSDALFKMTKAQLQKEAFQYVIEQEEEAEEKVELDGLHMARIEVASLIDDAEELLEMLSEMEEEPDAWVASKISLATDYIATVTDYLEFNSYSDEEEEEPEEEDVEDEYSDVEEAIRHMSKEDLGEHYDEVKDIIEEIDGLQKKADKSNIPYSTLRTVYRRGIESWTESISMTPQQWAFARVNSFVSGGATIKHDDADLWESVQRNAKFSQFAESVLEYGTDAARMAYARATPGQSQEIIMARYSADKALEAINSANLQRAFKLYSEEACCDECVEEDLPELEENLSLWKYNKITGIWKQERSVTPETKDKWLEIFKKDSPDETYVISSKKPSKKPMKESEEILEEVDWDLVLHEAEYQGKDVSLNKPFYTPDGPKKSAVYTMGPNGKVVIVRFGDPNMEIKKDNPERRKSFRARHNCDEPGPKWSAKYWSCKAW